MKKFSLRAPIHLPLDRVTAALNRRTPREQHLLIGFFILFLLAADYLLILSPTLALLQTAVPRAFELQKMRDELAEDRKNAPEIRKKWAQTRALVEQSEKAVIPATATPALLESLSKLAGKTGVKITSVKPAESPRRKSAKLFSPLPIHLSGLAGTHELGRFLSHLEAGETFFRVTELSIAASPLNERRHKIDITLEACKREPQRASAGGA